MTSQMNADVYAVSAMTANTKKSSLIPSGGKPNTTKKNTSVNGVLRSRFTYPPAKIRNAGTGETRMAANTVPNTIAPIADSTNSLIVFRNASRKRPALSVSVWRNSLIAGQPLDQG